MPTVFTPSAARSKAAETTVAATTATSTAGIFFETPGNPSSSASVPRPTRSVVVFVSIEVRQEGADLVDEAVGVGREAEELGQLADDDRDGQPVHVADLDLLGEQVGDEPQLAQAQADLDEAYHERQHPRHGDRAGGVVRHDERHDGGEDERRDGRVRAEDEHARRPEKRVHDETGDRRVEAGDGRETGQLSVREPLRHQDGREDDAGDEVEAQPRRLVRAQHAHARHGRIQTALLARPRLGRSVFVATRTLPCFAGRSRMVASVCGRYSGQQ